MKGHIGSTQFGIFSAGSAYENEVLADDPVGYWRLADLTDSSGNGLTLTQAGTVTDVPSLIVSDPDNGAKRLQTDYQVDALTHADDPLLRLSAAFTMEAWIKPAFIDRFQPLQKFQSYSLYLQSSGKFRAEVYTNSGFYGADSTTIFTSNDIYHVVGTFDGSNVRLYVNGELEATTATPGIPLNNTNRFCLGADAGHLAGWWGVIDEAALYSTVLTPERILAHYLVGTGAATETLESITAPVVSGSTAIGSVLTCSTGVWSLTGLSYTYQWKRAGVDIAGETANTYTIQGTDFDQSILCTVTAASATDELSVDSNAIAPTAGVLGPLVVTIVDDAGNTVDGEIEVRRRDDAPYGVFVDENGTALAVEPFSSNDGIAVLWLIRGRYEWRAVAGTDITPWVPVDVPGVS